MFFESSKGNAIINSIKSGGALPSINISQLKDIKVPVPPIEEQNKIGLIFNNIDNLITLHQHKELKRRNDNNEHLRW